MISIRSCRSNIDKFWASFNHFLNQISCIVLTETWLTSDTDNCFIIPDFYCFNLYRNRFGGGIKIFLRNAVQAKLLADFTFIGDFFETITIELNFEHNKKL